ncbi:MAG: sensor histidine kinase [Eubacteriales bacterium]|nr:sensor histidine kinase [Eubacteriales bacterium]
MRFGFRFRIMAAMLAVAGACVLAVALISYSDSKSMIEENYVQSLDASMTLQMNSFDDTMKEMYQTVQHISTMPELEDCIDTYLSSDQTYADGTEVARQLSALLTFNRWGSTLYLYLPEVEKAFSSEKYYAARENAGDAAVPWHERPDNPFIPLYFTDRIARASQHVFAYVEPVLDRDGEEKAFLCITVDERKLYYALLDDLNGTDGEEYMILSKDGMICSAADITQLGTRISGLSKRQDNRMNANMGESGLLFTSVEAPYSHYRMLCQSDLRMLTQDIREHMIYLLLVVALVFTGLIVLAKILSDQLYRPIQELTEAMDNVGGGDFTARVNDRKTDEFGVVRAHFNEMVSRMDNLMEQVVQERTQKREAEINALQYQIRPHFMYNTLNSIRFAATLQRNHKLAELLGDFIALLEASTQRKGAFLPLCEEIRLVQSYLSLQAFRYFDCFEVVYSIAPETEDCYVPCLLLQPMVENAVFHGIDPKRNDNRLEITSWMEGERLHITVEDNGDGFDMEKGETLDQEEEKRRLTGIGMQNVKQRMKLYYGDAAYFTVHSEVGVGTQVEFCMPVSHDPEEYSIRKSGTAE